MLDLDERKGAWTAEEDALLITLIDASRWITPSA